MRSHHISDEHAYRVVLDTLCAARAASLERAPCDGAHLARLARAVHLARCPIPRTARAAVASMVPTLESRGEIAFCEDGLPRLVLFDPERVP